MASSTLDPRVRCTRTSYETSITSACQYFPTEPFRRLTNIIFRVLLMGSTSALVIGFSFAGQDGWSSPRTLGLILTGIGGLLIASVWETSVGTRALLPPGIFKQATIVNVLAISILHNFAFNAGTYFIPVYYQAVNGDTPFRAGMRVLPFSLGSALASVPVAQFISFRTGPAWIDRSVKICICLGMALATIGYGTYIYTLQNVDIWAHHSTIFLTFPSMCRSYDHLE